MSDNERPRDRFRDRDSRREPREGRERGDRGGTPNERRNRSRSPRRERGGRRDNRYRSRSPRRRDEAGRGDRGRGDHARDRGRDDTGRSFPERDRARSPPKGPRASAAPPSRPNDSRPSGGPVRPPAGPRAAVNTVKKEDSPDVVMKEELQKPEDMDDDTWEMQKMMGFGGFKSTKNTKVPGNDRNFGIRRDKHMEARQYMNRQGGFNRPLSPGRS